MLLTDLLFGGILLSPIALAVPHGRDREPEYYERPNTYTLTVYKKQDPKYNGLKVEGSNMALFQSSTASYCPDSVRQSGSCPNGTELAFSGQFYPYSIVPGGQEFYVAYDGEPAITRQHSHSFPSNSYPYYYGWTWTAFEKKRGRKFLERCPRRDPVYDCRQPSGYWTFKAPDGPAGYEGGLMACPSKYAPEQTSVWMVTPGFSQTGCVKLDGLATHNYTGPPVWAY
ncbi:hypothetical protein H2201_002484 [Coniosporium apollinis]|uniref:DUF1996 domain-containing protein n=2 Tax=Coniosporium TaxID=2810619 RepID=A0ABQ9P357_9PEZI|nr:hypothetical protein H2199_006002 [Cladosporium sp. JES 115]KAJ9667283.1 hypothetical protein H2201_002484 [Coniosporium apollinis]